MPNITGLTFTGGGDPLLAERRALGLPMTGVSGATGAASKAGGIGSVAGVGSIESLTQMVNEINQRAQQAANAGRIPGGAGLEQQSSTNIGSALRGEVPQDVLNLLGQQAAERGVSTGSPMGPASNADYLRSLGLTSLGQMDTGQKWLSNATARNPAAPIYDAGNQVLTAAQVQQAILERERMANALRIAQLNAARGGGGGGGRNVSPSQGIQKSATNWSPVFGPDQQLPTRTAMVPTNDPSFSNAFMQSGGTYQPTFGENPTLSFETDWNDLLFGGNPPGGLQANTGVSDEDWANYWFPPDEGG